MVYNGKMIQLVPPSVSQMAAWQAGYMYLPVRPRRPNISDEKQYKCVIPHCGKAYYRPYELARHCKIKHGCLNPPGEEDRVSDSIATE